MVDELFEERGTVDVFTARRDQLYIFISIFKSSQFLVEGSISWSFLVVNKG